MLTFELYPCQVLNSRYNSLMLIFIALATVVSTFLGGLFAIKFKDKLHLILGFSAGAVVGVAFFDLLPEALNLTSGKYSINITTSIVALGFIIFMLLDRFFAIHSHDVDCQNKHHRGRLGAITLSIHSFLDGAAIGLAFKVNTSVGIIVTAAVLAHDFSDGINTISLIIKNNGSTKEAFRWLIIDALAPLIGVLTTFFFSVQSPELGIILAGFCGFFLYIGASDLLPESHHRHPARWTSLTTVFGMAVIYIIIHLV